MPYYSVTLPIRGKIEIEVEAADEESAIEAARDAEYTIDNMHEWEVVPDSVNGSADAIEIAQTPPSITSPPTTTTHHG